MVKILNIITALMITSSISVIEFTCIYTVLTVISPINLLQALNLLFFAVVFGFIEVSVWLWAIWDYNLIKEMYGVGVK